MVFETLDTNFGTVVLHVHAPFEQTEAWPLLCFFMVFCLLLRRVFRCLESFGTFDRTRLAYCHEELARQRVFPNSQNPWR